jgi:hypothetical protein
LLPSSGIFSKPEVEIFPEEGSKILVETVKILK